jgi:hypothetical protein
MTTAAILPTTAANGASSSRDLFALTDEQILEIEPIEIDTTEPAAAEQPIANVAAQNDGRDKTIQDRTSGDASAASAKSAVTDKPAQAPALREPPGWLSRQMKDPWAGEEARELWEGVQRAQAEAAEYKQVFEKPEAARAAAERARALDEFDAAYFGGAGKSAEETSASRVALAQRMLREDPAAFEEMVQAGVRALEEAKKQGNNTVTAKSAPSATDVRQNASRQTADAETQRHLAAYSEFEKAANHDLEKSVGATIERALQQSLPNAGRGDSDGLKLRLATGVRQEIEKALQGDRQLGEQVAQVLSARRFDETARAQVVRLINERAQQLVPSATKRVLNDWTQTALAAHRTKTQKQEAASQRTDLAPAQAARERAAAGSEQKTTARSASPAPSRGRIDYKKLTDEQILEL